MGNERLVNNVKYRYRIDTVKIARGKPAARSLCVAASLPRAIDGGSPIRKQSGDRIILAVILCVAAWALSGCGEQPPDAALTYISGAEHNLLDPQRMSWSHDIRLARLLYEPLVRLDFHDMTIHPGVARSWDISEDKRTYTFHLRSDAKWSSGQKVTARDFLFAWRRAMLPDVAAAYSSMMFHIQGAKKFFDYRAKQLKAFVSIRKRAKGKKSHTTPKEAAKQMWTLTTDAFQRMVGVKAPDDHTLVVTLNKPTPYFLDLAAFATFMPVDKKSVKQASSIKAQTGRLQVDPSYWSDPVTNGPYVIDHRSFRQFVSLKANDQYWDRDSMGNDSVVELIVPDPSTALQKYEAHQAEMHLGVPSAGPLARALSKRADQRADVHVQPMAGTYFYNFNCNPKLPSGQANPLADSKVRRALSLAINRKTLVNHVTGLDQPIARTFIPPHALKKYQPPVQAGITFDPERGRALLAQAGHANGKGLGGLSILYNTGANHQAPAQAIKRMWEEHLHVSVQLEGVRTKAFSQRLQNQNYTICRASWFGDYPDPTTWLNKMTSDANNNDTGWSNAPYDALMAKASNLSTGPKRRKTLRRAETILVKQAPMALLFHYVNLYLYDPAQVTGIQPNPWARWQLQNARVKPQ